MDPKKIDGDRFILQFVLPPSVHVGASIVIALVVAVALAFTALLTPVLGLLGVLIAYYTVFYARQAIRTSYHNSIVLATIDYSRRFGDARVQEARWALGTKYEALSKAMSKDMGADEKILETGTEFAKKIGNSRPEPVAGERPVLSETLFDDAIIILDYCEDLAVGIERGALDEATARDLPRSAVCKFWTYLGPLVEYQRIKRGSDTFYIKFEALASSWKNQAK